MRREVLEGVESRAELVHIDTVETLGRLAEREVADGPRAWPGEMASEEPLRRPWAEPAERRDPRADLVVVELCQAVEVEVAAREADRVLGLQPREPDLEQLFLPGPGDAFARRERPRVAEPRRRSARSSRLRIATAA